MIKTITITAISITMTITISKDTTVRAITVSKDSTESKTVLQVLASARGRVPSGEEELEEGEDG